MVEKLRPFSYYFFAFFLLVLTIFLRFDRYFEFPVGGETRDEYAWTMLGASLIQTGTPISWSYFESYIPFRELQFGANSYPIVRPALDHPPLFSLLPGMAHVISGKNWDDFGSLKVIRFPMVLLGIFNFILLFVLLEKISTHSGRKFLALAIYGTVPSFVFASRLVVAENLLTTWFLLMAILLSVNSVEKQQTFFSTIKIIVQKIFTNTLRQQNQIIVSYFIILLCILATLTKISGLTLPLAVFVYGILLKDRRLLISALLGGVLGIFSFFAYGLLYDWNLFVAVFSEQSGREIGFATLHNRFFLHPTIVSRLLIDGWSVAGLLVMFSHITEKKSELLFPTLGVFVQLIFIALSVGETTFHGWYVYSIFPFLSIFISWFIFNLLEKKQYLYFWMLWLFLLPIFRIVQSHTLVQIDTMVVRIFILIGGLPLFFSDILQKQKLSNYALYALLLLLLSANVIAVSSFQAQHYWEDDEYFLPKVVVK